MKHFRKLLIGLLFCLLLVGPAHAFKEYSISSGELAASYQVVIGERYLASILVLTDGSNAVTVAVYDSSQSSTSAKKVFEMTVTGADNAAGRNYRYPIKMQYGIYVTATGTGVSYFVEYVEN